MKKFLKGFCVFYLSVFEVAWMILIWEKQVPAIWPIIAFVICAVLLYLLLRKRVPKPTGCNMQSAIGFNSIASQPYTTETIEKAKNDKKQPKVLFFIFGRKKATRVFFVSCGMLVYTACIFIEPDLTPVFVAMDVLMGFFLFLLLRKPKAKPDHAVSQTYTAETIEKSENDKKQLKVPFFTLGGRKANKENEKLRTKVAELESLLTPEMQDLVNLRHCIEDARSELSTLNASIATASEKLKQTAEEINATKSFLIETNEAIMLQEFGLYEPRYDFMRADDYKARLLENRAQQKDLIKAKKAATGSTIWTVNGNKQQGDKMVSDMQKLLVRAFNSECESVISTVKFNNIESAEKRITASREAISKLGSMMSVSITPGYYQLKLSELYLAYEYQLKKQQEKEEQRHIREEMREQEKLKKEIETARKNIIKEEQHYKNALKQAEEQLLQATDSSMQAELQSKIADLQTRLSELSSELQAVDYREANQKAGYVYVISNIGAFGENVYKIGMTRRLDPMDRIYELGGASVPFNFDVHAMIFTDDAPKLETALHHAFETRKINMVNQRREFFRVSLDEIKSVIKANFDKTVEFVDIPDAEQYRESLLIQNHALKR